jgi:spore germination cell wall hydrolase CwlJ-like protein
MSGNLSGSRHRGSLSLVYLSKGRVRALIAATSIGLLIGASIGSAYLGIAMSRDKHIHDQAQRMLVVAARDYGHGHFLDLSLVSETSGSAASVAPSNLPLDRSAMAIAMRFDPYDKRANGLRQSPQSLVTKTLLAQNVNNKSFEKPKANLRDKTSNATHIIEASLSFGLEKSNIFKAKPQDVAPFAPKVTNQKDSDCLTQAVYYEARGEGEDGMRAVAQVILNRVRHPAFPKSICAVVYQGGYRSACQFSFACNGVMNNRIEAWSWKRAQSIAQDALSGFVMKAVGTSTHFHTTQVNPVWAARLDRVALIGDHIFYQYRGLRAKIDDQLIAVRPSESQDTRLVTLVSQSRDDKRLTALPQAEIEAGLQLASLTAQPEQAFGGTPAANLAEILKALPSANQTTKAVQVEQKLNSAEATALNKALKSGQ